MGAKGAEVGTLIIGLLVVAVSAGGLALSMFGGRPPIQPATAAVGPGPSAVTTASQGRSRRRQAARPATERSSDVDQAPRLQVEVPTAVRVRSAFVLGLAVITAAAVIGVVLSVVIVGAFTLIG